MQPKQSTARSTAFLTQAPASRTRETRLMEDDLGGGRIQRQRPGMNGPGTLVQEAPWPRNDNPALPD